MYLRHADLYQRALRLRAKKGLIVFELTSAGVGDMGRLYSRIRNELIKNNVEEKLLVPLKIGGVFFFSFGLVSEDWIWLVYN